MVPTWYGVYQFFFRTLATFPGKSRELVGQIPLHLLYRTPGLANGGDQGLAILQGSQQNASCRKISGIFHHKNSWFWREIQPKKTHGFGKQPEFEWTKLWRVSNQNRRVHGFLRPKYVHREFNRWKWDRTWENKSQWEGEIPHCHCLNTPDPQWFIVITDFTSRFMFTIPLKHISNSHANVIPSQTNRICINININKYIYIYTYIHSTIWWFRSQLGTPSHDQRLGWLVEFPSALADTTGDSLPWRREVQPDQA